MGELLNPNRWQQLVHQFRAENYRLHQLSSQSMFTVALQYGLACLKTPHCSQSRLICSISGRALDENNQPMMLPNGYVYGEQALTSQAGQNEGKVICPRTKEIYSFTDAEKVYIM